MCGRVRVEGDVAEAVAMVSRRNKFLRAPFAVRRGFCLRLGASGVGDPRLVEVAGYGGWRSIGTGRLDP